MFPISDLLELWSLWGLLLWIFWFFLRLVSLIFILLCLRGWYLQGLEDRCQQWEDFFKKGNCVLDSLYQRMVVDGWIFSYKKFIRLLIVLGLPSLVNKNKAVVVMGCDLMNWMRDLIRNGIFSCSVRTTA